MMIRKEGHDCYVIGIYMAERISPRLWAISTDRSGTIRNFRSLFAAYCSMTGEKPTRDEFRCFVAKL
jgi:hypothetical protein